MQCYAEKKYQLHIIISWFPMTPCEMYYKLIVPHWATQPAYNECFNFITLRSFVDEPPHHRTPPPRLGHAASRPRARTGLSTFYCWEQRVLLHAISIMTSGRWASGIANLLTWFAYKDQHGYSNSLVLYCSVAVWVRARAPRVSDYYVLRHDIKTKFYGWQMAQTAEWR